MMRFLNQLSLLWKQLGINQKISLVLSAGLVVAVMAGVLVWSSRPDMQLLYGRLDPKDAGDIVAALDQQGIPYELKNGGTTIFVPRAEVYRVRMDLASKGLPTGGSVGFEIFDRGNFGISDFVQRTNYLRAIQGELSRTISQLDGVRSARVMVVMPENRLLVTDMSRRSTASVLVDTGGTRLSLDAVNSIRSLVANAVEGLKVDDVVVVDNHGVVLSEELQSDPLGSGLSASQIRHRKGVEDYFTRKVESMLASVLGPGNAVVRVSVDIDSSSITTMEERFDPDGQVLRSATTTDDTTVTTQVTGGTAAPGAAAEGGAPAGGGQNNSEQTRKVKTEQYEIARSVINTVKNPGEIRRITAAVFLAMRATGDGEQRQVQPRSPEEIEAIRRMVVNALGVTPARGQPLDSIVSVEEMDFAPSPLAMEETVANPPVQIIDWLEVGKQGLLVVVGLGVFIAFMRLVKAARAEAPSLEIYQGEGGSRSGGGKEIEGELTPELLNQMIREQPANVGLTLKEWMSAEQK